MALFPSNIEKVFSFVLMILTTSFLLLEGEQVNSQKTVSFDFPKFSVGQSDVTLQGNAAIYATGTLALTNPTDPNWTAGRVLYSTPVPIWDKTTGNVASFVTSFSFVLEDYDSFLPADGIIFFLAPTNTVIPNNGTGGDLGVVDGNTAFNRFVGVEFDNYVNEWDPESPHIGIDVNSLISSKTAIWNPVSGSLVKVSIIYDSLSKTLSVATTDKDGQITTVSQVVDLKDVLPESVNIGLSASTSLYARQLHNIHSWSFTSFLNTATISSSSSKTIYIA
ncbi:putative bark agglutinin LECRPA3 [Vicia villosa]|uniref:putative bark agglutinin LECRPA3 n=1 Tax=Vicia villosa TaxID=3911 RepID=UPI00273C42BE|nr:putative bark agglutinin LECRPA3 [Vicia villosa]